MPLLENKAAIVTGGSRGIGRAIVESFVREGAKVLFTYLQSAEAAEEVVGQLSGQGQVEAIQADVKSADAARAVADAAIEKFGRLDILVNNAGILKESMLAFTKEADWDEIVDTNLKGSFLFSKAVIRQMARQRGGRIINISSDAALLGDVPRVGYCAAKAGVLGLTRAIAREVATQGITVNAVAPGIISTDLIAGLPEKKREGYLEHIPVRRFGEASEVASLVTFLASDHASYVTGQVISVDGGLRM